MAQKSHIFCIPFPGAGHAVNMINTALSIASPSVATHILVTSQTKAAQWMKATGQHPNPDVTFEVLADGQWETWEAHEPKEYVGLIRSPEFTSAVSDKISRTKQEFPQERISAMIANPMMSNLLETAKVHDLKVYMLMPTPYYMMRGGMALRPGIKPEEKMLWKGIGGSNQVLEGEYGDVLELQSSMSMVDIMAEAAHGMIYTNTNIGLEGDQYKQPQLPPATFREPPPYFIGPILPPWYENALDEPALYQQHRQAISRDDCTDFLDKQPSKSVVYVALGSHVDLELDQAIVIVQNLRRHETPWILLFRNNRDEAAKALIDPELDDGVVTSWAPQLEILIHPATKCVISHGGFGTMIEGVFAGQPFITSPVMSDQFIDTRVMQHLGICLGTIAENRHVNFYERTKMVPFWPDDGGKAIQRLFDHVFGSAEGEKELENGRQASRDLRKRMINAKATDGVKALQQLREDMMHSKA